ncbi:MAG: colicin immunity domain-containing protein [Rhodovibrionaceae bacterium]
MDIKKYIKLLESYTSHNISSLEFETQYLKLFKIEPEGMPEDIYDLLNNLFINVDAYCDNSSIRDEEDLGPHELLDSARETLGKLRSLCKEQ